MRTAIGTAAAALTIAAAIAGAQAPSVSGGDGSGRELFVAYCASCHGTSGRGDGPAADVFRTRPADLTKLAAKTNGIFAADTVSRVVAGRGNRAHGSVEMPVWGEVFKRMPGLDDSAVKARIDAIVQYLRSIQERSS
jgi:mono/diheme cytochrome c family protein